MGGLLPQLMIVIPNIEAYRISGFAQIQVFPDELLSKVSLRGRHA